MIVKWIPAQRISFLVQTYHDAQDITDKRTPDEVNTETQFQFEDVPRGNRNGPARQKRRNERAASHAETKEPLKEAKTLVTEEAVGSKTDKNKFSTSPKSAKTLATEEAVGSKTDKNKVST